MAWTLVVVILAVSNRSILAPTQAVTRSQESKRPKMPKNIVRAEASHTANIDRISKMPRPDPSVAGPQASHDLQVRTTLAPQVPADAFHELTKPDYLKLAEGSPPRNRLAPPA
jgi:hypothetical protein